LKQELLNILVDPATKQSLQFESGRLRAGSGATYPVITGIPRFVQTRDEAQLQTKDSFGFKWKQKETYRWMMTEKNDAPQAAWLLEKYGFSSVADWAREFAAANRILDLGCGAGMASWPWLSAAQWTGQAMWVGVDISEAVEVAAELLGSIPNTHFVQADALQLPFAEGTFEIVLSEGVLHHTPSTRDAIAAAARTICQGGRFYFYVYRRKGPVREFTDDHIRQAIAGLSDAQAWEAMRSLTMLARKLSDLHATVIVDEDVPLLGIKAGEEDVQRLIYWNFAKLYWNDALSFEENVHVNFDWYRPRYAHRQSEAEVRSWCTEAGLSIERFHEQQSGFSVVAVRS
jgi:SAM-dependent methyltransferase